MPASLFELTSNVGVTNVQAEERPFLAATDAATTLTAAQAVGGIITMTPTTGRTLTPPTAAQLRTYFDAQLEVGTSFEFTVVNASAATAITLASGVSGMTNVGAAAMATISGATSATYLVYCTNASSSAPAFSIVRKG